MINKIKVLGVCGGGGVILYPFLHKSFKLLANIEPRGIFGTPQQVQWKLNFNDIPLYRGLAELYSEVDVIVGAPDCGHSSILSYSRAKKFADAKDNKSLTLFIKAVQETYTPKMFIMENLEALLKNYGEEDLKEAFSNYNIKLINGPVSNFGNSQIHRKRLLVIGVRKDLPKKLLKAWYLPELNMDALKTCGQLINDLRFVYPSLKLGHVRENDNTFITIYAGKKLKVGEIKKIWLTKHLYEKRLPVEGRNFTSAPGVYKNLEEDYPATARKQNRQFNHFGEMMSPRELARIQGLPDEFKIAMDDANIQYWINKGRTTVSKTPPHELAVYIKRTLIKIWKKHNLNPINNEN
jgi:site-specific DNA-cytosine methylase